LFGFTGTRTKFSEVDWGIERAFGILLAHNVHCLVNGLLGNKHNLLWNRDEYFRFTQGPLDAEGVFTQQLYISGH